MPSRQTKIHSHFTSSNKAGPSRTRGSRNTKPKYEDLSQSESEGSEGLDHVKMKDTQPDRRDLPMTQRRALKNKVYDSDDDSDDQSEEEGIDESDEEPLKRKGSGGVKSKSSPYKRKGKGKDRDEEYVTTDPEDEFISYPLTGKLPLDYVGTHSQKVKRRNERLEAVEIARKKQKQDILTDDEIEVFPSPPSPSNRRIKRTKVGENGGNTRAVRSTRDTKGKGKQREEEDDEDDIVPIDPPTSSTQKPKRNSVPKIPQIINQPSSPLAKAKRPVGRPRLNLQRTKSEVIVEIPRMSQEERRSYTSFTPSQSSQSASRTNVTNKGKEQNSVDSEIGSSSHRPKSRSNIPIVEIPSRRGSPDHETQTNDSLPPILEVELSDKDLDILTDGENGGSSSRAKSKSKSPIKRSSPLKQPSPVKQSTNAIPVKPSTSTRISLPAKAPSSSRQVSPSKASSTVSRSIPVKHKRLSPSPSHSSSSSIAVSVPSKRKDKGKGKQKAVTSSDEEDSMPIKKSRKPAPLSLKSSNKHLKVPEKHCADSKAKIVDPDDVDTEEEEDMLDDLKMDEPERFKSKTRLRNRPKESAAQRNIRKLKNKRLGIVESSTDNSSSEESSPTHSDGSSSEGSDEESFIVEDDDARGPKVQLPHEFSVDSAQTPEFKFKVVFHYLVLLVMKGKKAFPLSAESSNYFKPQLLHFRDRMTGYRQLRVRSQIWRANFVKAMEKYPLFEVEELLYAEPGCDACHMGGRMSKFRISLEGLPYDKETHQSLDTSDEEEDESEDSDDSEASERARKKLPRSMLMGKFCKARAEVFHHMTHWEDELYHRIRGYYRDLLRAKYKPVPSDSEASTPESELDPDEDPLEVTSRKQNRKKRKGESEIRCEKIRKRGGMPNDTKDVDLVTEWMDKMGFQNKDFRWIERLIDQSDQLEHDKRRDE